MKLHIVKALLLKYWYITKNRVDRVFDLFYWPLMALLVWGFTTYYLRDYTGSAIINILIGGVVLWTFFHRAQQDITTYTLEDFWSRNLYNLFSTPLKWSELIISIVLFGFLRALISFAFLSIIAYLLFSFNVFGAGIFAIAVFASGLMLFGWVMGIFVAAMIFRYGMRIQVFAWSLSWLIQPFSAVFYPLAAMPAWIQKVSIIFPTTHIFEGLRYAFKTNLIPWNHVIYAFALNIVLLVAACWFFKISLDNAKKKGLLTRHE